MKFRIGGIIVTSIIESRLSNFTNSVVKSLEAENNKLRSEVRNLKTSLDIAGSNKVTNVELLKRISDLEKVVYGE